MSQEVQETIKRLDEILDALNEGDLMEVYGYLSGKMMRHMFGDDLNDEQLLKIADVKMGGTPFGDPVGKKITKGKSKKSAIDPEDFMQGAIYDTAVEDVRCLTLRVEMEEIQPPVWREVVVPSNLNLESLGHILVDVMGWEGYHLHQFVKGNEHYAIPDEEFGGENPFKDLFGPLLVKNHDSRDFTVGEVLARKRSWIDYEYDFGDSWMHRVTVVDSRKYGKGEKRKVELIAGANACPPEDCGGVWGYEELVESLKKPQSKRAKELRSWLGYTFDPTEFDLEEFKEDVEFYNSGSDY